MHRCLLSITQFWLQKWMQSWISPITYIPSLKSKKHIFFSNSWPRLRLQRFSKHLHEFQGDPDLLKGPICFCLKKAMFSPAYTDPDLLQTPDTPSQKGFPFFREWLGNACVESWLQSCFCWKGGRWQASPAQRGGEERGGDFGTVSGSGAPRLDPQRNDQGESSLGFSWRRQISKENWSSRAKGQTLIFGKSQI